MYRRKSDIETKRLQFTHTAIQRLDKWSACLKGAYISNVMVSTKHCCVIQYMAVRSLSLCRKRPWPYRCKHTDCHQYWLRLISAAAADDVVMGQTSYWNGSDMCLPGAPMPSGWDRSKSDTTEPLTRGECHSSLSLQAPVKSVTTTSSDAVSCQSSRAQSLPRHPWTVK